jgi:hypothetical protein
MKNVILFFIFCLFSINVIAQINVQIDIKDCCSDSIKIINGELIDKYGNIHQINLTGGFYELAVDTGYFISLKLARNNSTYLINHSFDVSLNDTVYELIYLPKLIKGSFDNFYDEKFYICEKVCDGNIEDYYHNGNIRIKGNFKQGVPQGKVFYYNTNGTLSKVEKYNKKGKLKKTIKY